MNEADPTTGQRLQARVDEETYDFTVEEEGGAFRIRIDESVFIVHRRDLGPRGLMSPVCWSQCAQAMPAGLSAWSRYELKERSSVLLPDPASPRMRHREPWPSSARS